MEKFNGYFGQFGGSYVSEDLKKALLEITESFYKYIEDKDFLEELKYYQTQYIGRANPLYYAKNLTDLVGGAKLYLKREDLNHTGAHKINNTIGQALLAKKMGKKRIIAETGAGQHGVATATVCALFNMECTIYMGEVDMERQSLNVFKMKMLGAKVVPATTGSKTLKDAVDAALADYADSYENTFYLLGSVVGPHPYPLMVREFQSIIGKETKEKILQAEGKLPDYLVACVGGGSNSIGLFHEFIKDDVKIIGVEPAGKGLETGQHAASLTKGKIGIIHGFKCYTLQDDEGNISRVHSIAAGLDYPGVGPEHCLYKFTNRVKYESITDDEALKAFKILSQKEGIIPALESAHAVAYGMKLAKDLDKNQTIIINLSGRGDKDMMQVKDLNLI